ncbi:DUF1190 domain-containing protein [Roseomonas eburnea]|uniref:DUF1190 domain-containing protein n=1 Tax=Neoroseomonas eburnea TaxID=1346889 RepID=A0A9X9XCE7_9PROT|nr:DUF1190 domain-containing protein [Neoroseomonas eburnea]MBR0681383.1 DUF1190 domain-containing protein [Neoroseomonas eburnea]
MPQGPAPPSRRRSRTVRAAALVTLGLGAVGCDEAPPPDLPGQAAARLDACRAAHRRLGEDPARCDALEQAIEREHAETRPQFRTFAECQAQFGPNACEGDVPLATGSGWRPVPAGWSQTGGLGFAPVLQARDGQFWRLSEASAPATGGVASLPPPQPVAAPEQPERGRMPAGASLAYYRLVPIYPDEAACTEVWQRCETVTPRLANRYASEAVCRDNWSSCVEAEFADLALPAAAAAAAAATSGTGSGTAGTGGGSSSRPSWWVGYNNGWSRSYGSGIGPRYQGWTWTADRQPTAAYRPASGTGPLLAWDSSSRRLGAANRMGTYSGPGSTRVGGSTVSRPTSTITRAGFGSTGRAYSSGG